MTPTKRFAFFPGCKIPFFLDHYGTSCRSVLEALGVRLVELEFNCCGYPARELHFDAFVLSAARNIAMAGRDGLPLLTPCKCCFGTLKYADHWLRNHEGLRRAINAALREEGLAWDGTVEIHHLLSFLAHEVGTDTLRAHIERPYRGLRIAAHYGCHALRPGRVMRFDNPLAPTLFEDLVAVTGAEPVEWARRLECCGHPLWGKNDRLSRSMMEAKLSDARRAGADYICTACTHCQIQFDAVQADLHGPTASGGSGVPILPSVLYTQLLGLAMGIAEGPLGIERNRVELGGITRYLCPSRST